METSTIAAFAAIVPGQVAVAAAKTEDAALNMVWNSTHINTPLFPDILRIAPRKKRSAIHCTANIPKGIRPAAWRVPGRKNSGTCHRIQIMPDRMQDSA